MSLLQCLPSAIAGQTSALPHPQFAIGDRVAEDWEADDARGIHHSATDFGEIVGARLVAENESWLPVNTWIYFVRWTHSTCPAYTNCPYYDGEPSLEEDLRLA